MRLLISASLLLALACSDTSKDDTTPPADARATSADAGATVDAAPVIDAMGTEPDAMLGQLGAQCGQDADGLACGAGLACCYPCGIPGCEFECTEACEEGSPACVDGCLLLP